MTALKHVPGAALGPGAAQARGEGDEGVRSSPKSLCVRICCSLKTVPPITLPAPEQLNRNQTRREQHVLLFLEVWKLFHPGRVEAVAWRAEGGNRSHLRGQLC